ncbi:MAG: DNA repair exonuclease [Thermoguttaceae bacterium]|jgi:DNA repair exonuclease SbcCD nuclease subunit
MFRFLHAADIHLDSPLRGLDRYDGAPVEEVRRASRSALENLVACALEEGVQFVLIAGDLYDGDWRDYNTGLCFVKQMSRLRDAGIPVYLVAGNHDAANKMTRALRLPANPAGDDPMLSPRRPETRRLDDLGVAIHGRSFATAAETANLAVEYPPADRGMFNIGLLHTSLEGDAEHATYAPCSLADLAAREYQYWALGHIHKRRQVGADPLVVYPGNVQGRHIRESGEKGCCLVAVSDSHEVSVQFRPLDVFRWELCRVNCRDAADGDDVLDRFGRRLRELLGLHAPLPLGIRVALDGPCPAHQRLAADQEAFAAQIRATAIEVSSGRAWVEKVEIGTSYPTSTDAALAADGPGQELSACLDELLADRSRLEALAGELDSLKKKLPAELLEGPDALACDDPAWLAAMLGQVRPLLLQRLAARENA